jgi:glutathione S-transferase
LPIPVLIDGDLVLCDSSVICAYLDEAYPGAALLPADARNRARARWLEEFADTRLGEVFIWGLFYQKIVRPMVFGEPGDAERIERTLNDDAPRALDYLERELPASGFLFGEIGIADIAIAAMFRNADYSGFTPDPARWPRAVCHRHARPPGVRIAAAVRGRPARLDDQGPALGAARGRCPADRRNDGPA